MRGLFGYVVLLLLAFGLSEGRGRIGWRTVVGGVALQWLLAVVLLDVPAAQHGVGLLNRGADALQVATDQGTAFLFGYLGGGALPFVEVRPGVVSFWPSRYCLWCWSSVLWGRCCSIGG